MLWHPASHQPLSLRHIDGETIGGTKRAEGIKQPLDHPPRRTHQNNIVSEQQHRYKLPRNPQPVQVPRSQARQLLAGHKRLQAVHIEREHKRARWTALSHTVHHTEWPRVVPPYKDPGLDVRIHPQEALNRAK